MQLIPEGQRPVSGTAGALQRRRKLLTQLPVYDQDPMKCQSLASEEEVLRSHGTLMTRQRAAWRWHPARSSWSSNLFSTSCRFLPCCSL